MCVIDYLLKWLLLTICCTFIQEFVYLLFQEWLNHRFLYQMLFYRKYFLWRKETDAERDWNLLESKFLCRFTRMKYAWLYLHHIFRFEKRHVRPVYLAKIRSYSIQLYQLLRIAMQWWYFLDHYFCDSIFWFTIFYR